MGGYWLPQGRNDPLQDQLGEYLFRTTPPDRCSTDTVIWDSLQHCESGTMFQDPRDTKHIRTWPERRDGEAVRELCG